MNMWMSRVTHVNESFHTCKRVMSHVWTSHVTHIQTCEWVVSRMWISRVTHKNESCHTYERVMSRVLRHVRAMQSVAVWCSVMQCDAVCCCVLQCHVTRIQTCPSHAECCSVLRSVAECCSVLQCVAVCCSVLQCVAVCCSVTSRVFRHVQARHTYERVMSLCSQYDYWLWSLIKAVKKLLRYPLPLAHVPPPYINLPTQYKLEISYRNTFLHTYSFALLPLLFYVCTLSHSLLHTYTHTHTRLTWVEL